MTQDQPIRELLWEKALFHVILGLEAQSYL